MQAILRNKIYRIKKRIYVYFITKVLYAYESYYIYGSYKT